MKPTIEEANRLIEEEYQRAKQLEYVRKPLSYALYQVCRKIEKVERERKCEKKKDY